MAIKRARVQHLTDSAENWHRTNPVLLEGEIGLEELPMVVGKNNFGIKIGDGMTAWNALPYIAFTNNGNTTVQNVTKAEYDEMVHNANTLYITTDESNNVLMFMGENLLGGGSGGGGTTNYNDLNNLPTVNGVELKGAKDSKNDLRIAGKVGNADNSAVFGDGCSSYGENTLVGGKNTTASNDNSLLYGLGLASGGSFQAVFGKYNKYGEYYNVLLQVGNGSGDGVYRSNALTLDVNGNLIIAGSLTTADGELTDKANASDVYTKSETDSAITAKIAEIVAGAPEEFDTLKEMSDWLTEHEDSAAAMNTAIQKNATDISNRYTKEETDNKYLGKTETAAAAVLDELGGNIAEQIEQTKSDILKLKNDTFGTPEGRVASNSDLNAFTAVGAYVCVSSAAAKTLINCPVSVGFRIEVKALGVGVERYIQSIYPNSSDEAYCYFRRLTSDGWTAWYKTEGVAVNSVTTTAE